MEPLVSLPREIGARSALSAALSAAALLLALLVLVSFVFLSYTETVDMNMENAMAENVETASDDPVSNLIGTLLLLLFLLLLLLALCRLPTRVLSLLSVALLTAFGLIFVFSTLSAPTHDSYIVSNAAYRASLGDGSALDSFYFRSFPFQLGYVLFSEGIIRLFGQGDNYLVIEAVNVLMLAVAYLAILGSVRRLFGESCERVCALLMLLLLQPILFCTFTYGNIPGLAFGALGLLSVLSMRGGRCDLLRALLAALCFGIGVAIKKNIMILAVAAAILLLLRLLRRLRPSDVLALVLTAAAVVSLPAAATAHYEERFGLELGDGIPMISWAAMGLSPSYIAPGWYDGTYTVSAFAETGEDAEATAERAREAIEARLAFFASDPAAAAEFFREKLSSQWNEPTYQSLWTNQVRGRYEGEQGWLTVLLLDTAEEETKAYMNAVQQLLFLLATLGTAALLFRPRAEGALFPTVLLGGVLYHAVCEAKSQYALSYIVLLLPLAAYGASFFFAPFIKKQKSLLTLSL